MEKPVKIRKNDDHEKNNERKTTKPTKKLTHVHKHTSACTKKNRKSHTLVELRNQIQFRVCRHTYSQYSHHNRILKNDYNPYSFAPTLILPSVCLTLNLYFTLDRPRISIPTGHNIFSHISPRLSPLYPPQLYFNYKFLWEV